MDVRPLRTTNFFDLDLRGLDVSNRLAVTSDAAWLAAVDDQTGAVVTQLGGSSGEMRDGIYFYAMAVGRRLYLIESSNSPRIVRSAMDCLIPTKSSELPLPSLLAIATRGIKALYEEASGHGAAPAPTILGANGLPIGNS